MKTHEIRASPAADADTACKFCLRDFSFKHNKKRHEATCKHRPSGNLAIPENVAQIPENVAPQGQNVSLLGQNVSLLGQNVAMEGQNVAMEGQNVTTDEQHENDVFSCPLCYKNLSCKKALIRHKESCKGVKNPLMCHVCHVVLSDRVTKSRHVKRCMEEEASKALAELKSTMDCAALPSQQVIHINIANLQVNNNNNLQINNNLEVNGYGSEDLTRILKPEYLDERLREINGGGVFQMVRDVHFNQELPQNQNIRMGSLKRKTLRLKEEDGWHIKANDDVLDALINRYKRILITRSHEPGFRKSLQHETEFMQIQQDLLNFTKKNNPTAYYKCAHKILALIEDLERSTPAICKDAVEAMSCALEGA
jgi:hypothetical protein